MNRPLKFRAWDNHAKEWLLGYELPALGGFSLTGESVLLGEWADVINRFILQQKDRKPEDLIITQFTGCQDQNGKDIYEGDIVKRMAEVYDFDAEDGKEISYKEQVSVIEYRFHGFWVKDEDFGWEGEDLWEWNRMEVIGNIFENPELIK